MAGPGGGKPAPLRGAGAISIHAVIAQRSQQRYAACAQPPARKRKSEKVLIFRIAKRDKRPEEERDDLRGSLTERAGDSARQLASAELGEGLTGIQHRIGRRGASECCERARCVVLDGQARRPCLNSDFFWRRLLPTQIAVGCAGNFGNLQGCDLLRGFGRSVGAWILDAPMHDFALPFDSGRGAANPPPMLGSSPFFFLPVANTHTHTPTHTQPTPAWPAKRWCSVQPPRASRASTASQPRNAKANAHSCQSENPTQRTSGAPRPSPRLALAWPQPGVAVGASGRLLLRLASQRSPPLNSPYRYVDIPPPSPLAPSPPSHHRHTLTLSLFLASTIVCRSAA